MAGYIPQPDSSNTCCDCPERESPCDDCGGNVCDCPCSSVSIEIHAVATITADGVPPPAGTLLDMDDTQSHTFNINDDLDPEACTAEYHLRFFCVDGCTDLPNQGCRSFDFGITCNGDGLVVVASADFGCCYLFNCDPEACCSDGASISCNISGVPEGVYSDTCVTHGSIGGTPITSTMDITVTITCD